MPTAFWSESLRKRIVFQCVFFLVLYFLYCLYGILWFPFAYWVKHTERRWNESMLLSRHRLGAMVVIVRGLSKGAPERWRERCAGTVGHPVVMDELVLKQQWWRLGYLYLWTTSTLALNFWSMELKIEVWRSLSYFWWFFSAKNIPGSGEVTWFPRAVAILTFRISTSQVWCAIGTSPWRMEKPRIYPRRSSLLRAQGLRTAGDFPSKLHDSS